MTIPRDAEKVLAAWRDVEQDLEAAPEGSPEAERLRAEVERLRDEYQRLVDEAEGIRDEAEALREEAEGNIPPEFPTES